MSVDFWLRDGWTNYGPLTTASVGLTQARSKSRIIVVYYKSVSQKHKKVDLATQKSDLATQNYDLVAEGFIEAQGNCNAEFWTVLDRDISLLQCRIFVVIQCQSSSNQKNTGPIWKSACMISQIHFLFPLQPDSHGNTQKLCTVF